MITGLPKSLVVNGVEEPINADFRDVINLFIEINKPELEEAEKTYLMVALLYKNDIDISYFDEAVKQAMWFLDWGKEYEEKEDNEPKILDWEQDYNYIISAVNDKAKTVEDVRELPFLHWWTFLGYFAERNPKCQLSTIMSIREKIAKGQKLEQWEQEIMKSNGNDIRMQSTRDEELENMLWG